MRRGSYRDRAVVVRTYDFGEADRIIVLLTRTHGVVRSVAKGVRRVKSRFGSRLQPFVDLDVHLYRGKNLATVTEADTVAYYGAGIIEDYDRYTAACAVLETAERLAGMEAAAGDPYLYETVTETFARMQSTGHPSLVLDAFCLQAMSHAGWAPGLFQCAQCGVAGPHHAFHPAVGGAVCFRCRPSGSADVPEESLRLMWLLAHSHWSEARRLAEGPGGPQLVAAAHQLSTAHLQWHLETRITSLKVMDQR
ncbi:MAG TPA: DNA repair protein RecO [Corynebacterium sp.]|nr:DNA repair protein RecO [Corynebacterium sp.]